MASLNHYSCLSSLLTEAPSVFPSPSPQPKSWKISLSRNQSSPQPDSPSPEVGAKVDPVKLALKRAEAYKKEKAEQEGRERNDGAGDGDGEGRVNKGPVSVKLAMQRANEYEKNKGFFASAAENSEKEAEPSSSENNLARSSPSEVVEKDDGKKQELRISSIDFVGLEFADKKKTRGLPPGLVPVVDSFPMGDLPEVEIIVGDKTKFEETEMATTTRPEQVEDSDIYKPKVSTWGVFPRPNNISKTFGGGRNIRPGDLLETAEEKVAKEEKTRRLIAAYKEQIGLNIDPKLKLECEKELETGNSFMDSGKLKEALPYYEKVMEKMVFKSELHGLAALQWSICQDSLRKSDKARVMYEKLQSHPNPNVSKKARQFMFSFQAMDIMKVRGSSLSQKTTGYQNFFEAFIENRINYASQDDEAEDMGIKQTLPYVILLVTPILLVFIVAAQRGNIN